MELEDTDNAIPDNFGNVIHKEEEGKKNACSRNFDAIAKVLHGMPSVDESVVVKEGAFKYNMGVVETVNEDGSISVNFPKAIYSGSVSEHMSPGREIEIDTTQFGHISGNVTNIDG
jgi:hypothetical protein